MAFIKLKMIRTLSDYEGVEEHLYIPEEFDLLDLIGWWAQEYNPDDPDRITKVEEKKVIRDGKLVSIPIIPMYPEEKITLINIPKEKLVLTVIYPIVVIVHNRLFQEKAIGFRVLLPDREWEAYIEESIYDEIIS